MFKYLIIAIVFPFYVSGQAKGVQFLKGTSWSQLLVQAKEQGKYIFLDCMATWCRPCKAMDQYVFQDDSLGRFVDEKFFAARLQFDTTKMDDESIKAWRVNVKKIGEQYRVDSYPSFLFFNPEGELIHRGGGYKDLKGFRSLLQDALDSNRQYYRLLKKYKKGELDFESIRYLIYTGISIHDSANYLPATSHFIHDYLLRMSSEELFTSRNIQFLAYTLSPDYSSVVKIFWSDSAQIDRIMGKNYSIRILDKMVIRPKYINPFLFQDSFSNRFVSKEPNWKKLTKSIALAFNKTTAWRNILFAKLDWYRQSGQWNSLGKMYVEWFDEVGVDLSPGSIFNTNNVCWSEIFLHVTDKSVLRKAAGWMKIIVEYKSNETLIDTYANLLYKIGDVEKAIEWEEKAVQLKPTKKELVENLNKMKSGQPTW